MLILSTTINYSINTHAISLKNCFIIYLSITIYITIYKDDSLFCVHISKYQFYFLKYNYLLNFLKLTVTFTNFFTESSISLFLFFSNYQPLFSHFF